MLNKLYGDDNDDIKLLKPKGFTHSYRIRVLGDGLLVLGGAECERPPPPPTEFFNDKSYSIRIKYISLEREFNREKDSSQMSENILSLRFHERFSRFLSNLH